MKTLALLALLAQVSPGVFATLTTTDTTANSLHVGCAVGSSACTGGIKAGPVIASQVTVNSVGIIAADGRIPAISSTYFASLSASSLTGTYNAALGATAQASITATGTVTSGTWNSTLGATALASITATGTVTSGTWSASFGAVSGANLTTLNATNISSGTLANARLPSAISVTSLTASLTVTTATVSASGQITSGGGGSLTPSIGGNGLTFGELFNAADEGRINYVGYNFAPGQFRDLGIYDGKAAQLIKITNQLAADNGQFIAGGFSLHVGSLTRVGRTVSNSTNAINLYNGTAPSGTATGLATLYVTAGEMLAMDATGNASPITPHDDITNEWNFRSTDTSAWRVRDGQFIGHRYLKVDMERLAKFIDAIYGTSFVLDTDPLAVVAAAVKKQAELAPWARRLWR